MSSIQYEEAVNGALDRLQSTGFYLDHSFANHGPMAAEALARLGYCDVVDDWVEANIHHRKHGPLPDADLRIDPASKPDWQAALGDRHRGGDWVQLFRNELQLRSWPTVLEQWWPRLVPGLGGALTHGLIRTAHAVRSLAATSEPSALQLDELARGLGFWATVYSPAESVPATDSVEIDSALSDLTVEYAGYYTATVPAHPVPLIHTITAPAAMRLVLPHLPIELHSASLQAMTAVNRGLFAAFGGQRRAVVAPADVVEQDFTALAAEAVDLGDEHAIKICEAVIRENALRPDARYYAAASTAVRLIRAM